MKKLNNISLYRIIIIVLLCSLINKPVIYLAGFIVLLIFNYLESFIYIVLILLILFSNSIKTDYIKYGIVERKTESYFIVDKILYKVKIKSNDIKIGDIIKTNECEYLDDNDYLKKNIKFVCNDYEIINNFNTKYKIYNKVQSFEDNTVLALNKFLYNQNNYEDLNYNLGYGLAIYYLLKLISQKSNKIGLILLLLYSLIFYFDIKFYLLIIDILLKNVNSSYKYLFKILIICLININMFYNNSILLPLLISLYSKLNIKTGFKTYLSLVESYIFGYFNLIGIVLFKFIIYFQMILFLISLLLIFVPGLEYYYNNLIYIYSYINNIEVPIRGNLKVFGIILYALIIYTFKINNKYLKYIVIILVILSPFNSPFLHISFIDVGQGDATLIKLPFNRGNILIDTGSKYNYYKLNKYLCSEGIYKIDYLILTHNDSDHNGNIENLKNDFNIVQIVDKPTDISIKKIKLKSLYLGEFDNDNDNSLIYYLNVQGIDFLFTGDISNKAEKQLIQKYSNLKLDILKVSHHGSDTSTSESFIKNVLPKIAIISTSGMYGHPSNKTINTLNAYMVDSYITKQAGNVEIYITKIINLLKTQNGDFAIIKCDDIRN